MNPRNPNVYTHSQKAVMVLAMVLVMVLAMVLVL